MFETAYQFRLSTKQLIRNEYPLIEKSLYTFNTRKNRQYIVEIHRYEYRVYVLKFHDKNHSNSKDRYSFILNDFDAGTVLKTILAIALDILNKDEYASFAFVGARKTEEPTDASRTQRFRVYKRMSEYFLGDVTFLHSYEERSNSYLLVNNKNENPQAISETIIDMFARIFQGIENI